MTPWQYTTLAVLLAIGLVTLGVLRRAKRRRAETAPLTLKWRDGDRGK